jgi:hypothetical protein
LGCFAPFRGLFYLGHERWEGASVVQAAAKIFQDQLLLLYENGSLAYQLSVNDVVLLQRMLIGCFSEAALSLSPILTTIAGH